MKEQMTIIQASPVPLWGTIKTVCQLFGVGERQVYRWRDNGWVRVHAVGNSTQYKIEDVSRVMEEEAAGREPHLVLPRKKSRIKK